MDEKKVTEILRKNVKPVDIDYSFELNIFYESRKLKCIIIRNNPHKSASKNNVMGM